LSGIKHNLLGNLNYANGEYHEAAEQFSLAIAAAPNALFHRNLAGAYKELKEYSKARRELEAAFKLDDDQKAFDREMSLIANAEGNDFFEHVDYEKAIEQYQKAVKFDSGNDVIYSNLGGAWELSKEPGRRVEALDEALKAFTSAHEIKATERYERAIERLKLKKEFASGYGERVLDLVPVVTPIVIEIGLDLIPYIADDIGDASSALSAELANQLTSLRTRIQSDFGVKLPGIQFKDNLTGLSDEGYAILLAEVPVVSGSVVRDQFFSPASAEALATHGIIGTEAIDPGTGRKGFWIKTEDHQKAKSSNLELWTCMEFIIRHLALVVERNLAEFLGHQEVVEILEKESRKGLEEMRSEPEKLSALAAVSRALVEERVPIVSSGQIYEVFNRLYSRSTNLQKIVENIRALPELSAALRGNDKQYSLLPLGPRFEAELRNAIYQPDSHPVLAMEPNRCLNALTLLRDGIGDSGEVAVVVEDPELRPFVRLFELEFPNLAVLSQRELRSDLEFHTLAPAELDGEAPSTKPEFKSSNQISPADNDHAIDGRLETAGSEGVGITVFVNQSLIEERSNADDLSIDEMFSKLQDGLFSELGIILPQVRLEIDNALKSNQFRFKLDNREYLPYAGLESDEFLVNDVVSRLKLLKIEGKEATNPVNGNKCAIVRDEKGASATCRQAGLTTWGPAGFLVLVLSAEIRKSAPAFQTNHATRYILNLLESLYPELVKAALNRFSVEQLCPILKDLLNEEISIRDLRRILESLLSINGTTNVDLHRYIVFAPPAEGLCPVADDRDVDHLTTSDYSNFVRTSLKRYISHKYTRGADALAVYQLDAELEKRLSSLGAEPLTTEENAALLAAVKSELQSLPATAQNPVILTTTDIRRTVKRLIESDFPSLAVLSYQELSPDVSIQPMARISLSKSPEAAALP
jgi:type III secretory pathway component EscV/Tfp pilus assembly protein PilF